MARSYFANGAFDAALQTIRSSRDLSRNNAEAQLLMALCYYELNQLEQSESLLQQLRQDKRTAFAECDLYLARVHHARNEFSTAVPYYKAYLRTLRADVPERAMVIEEIRRCDNGLREINRSRKVVVENLGPDINTAHDEFAPVISPTNSSRLYFSTIRPQHLSGQPIRGGDAVAAEGKQLYSDMYRALLDGTRWLPAEPMHHLLNSPKHELLIDLSPDGKVLYFLQGWSVENGHILADTFQQQAARTLQTSPANWPLRLEQGDATPYLFNEGMILFSSRRPGGYGGLDLYWARRKDNGEWGDAVNLGPTINSAYDETTPFLAADGRTLFYSTNNSAYSMGGFDVLKAVFLAEESRWTQPENVGMPINSPGDDTYFRLLPDGFTGSLCSSRKDGYGLRDLYIAYFAEFQTEMEPQQPLLPEPPPVVVATPPAPATPPVATPPATVTPVAITPAAEQPQPKPAATPDNNIARQDMLMTAPPPPQPITPHARELLPPPAAQEKPAAAAELAARVSRPAYRITFSGEKLPSDGNTLYQLEAVLELMQRYTDLRLILSSYAPNSASDALFAAIRRAEGVGGFLMQRGLEGSRLFLRALPAEALAGQVLLTFQRSPADLAQEALPVLGQTPLDLTPYNQPLLFKVQFASTRGVAYTGRVIDQFSYPMIETYPGLDYYRYTVGAFTTYAEARQLQEQLKAAGIRGPFIAAYAAGDRLDQAAAEVLQQRYPDLQNYIQSR